MVGQLIAAKKTFAFASQGNRVNEPWPNSFGRRPINLATNGTNPTNPRDFADSAPASRKK